MHSPDPCNIVLLCTMSCVLKGLLGRFFFSVSASIRRHPPTRPFPVGKYQEFPLGPFGDDDGRHALRDSRVLGGIIAQCCRSQRLATVCLGECPSLRCCCCCYFLFTIVQLSLGTRAAGQWYLSSTCVRWENVLEKKNRRFRFLYFRRL